MNTALRDTALSTCRLLGDAANGRRVSPNTLPSENALLAFSKAHRIETLVSSALRMSGVREDVYRTLHQTADIAAFHQIKNDLTSAELLKALTQAGIDVLPLKGAALQAFYPEGWIRTSTDIDIFVPQEQLAAAQAVVTDAAFVRFTDHDGDVCFKKPPRTVVELHTALGGYSKQQCHALARLSKTPFTVNEHYVYTLFHLYKHILYAGAGVRLFWDMYCLSRAATDRRYIEQWLEELGLLPFDRAVHIVCGILFDGHDCTEDMADAVDLVIASGTFGTSETYHAIKHVSRPVTHKGRVKTWIDDNCFDKRSMTARYPVLERRGWLYPVYVVKRVAHGMIFKRTVLKKVTAVEHAADRKHITRALKAMCIL